MLERTGGSRTSFDAAPSGGSRPLKGLVACEFSATVRDELRILGIDAYSCDMLPCEGDSEYHIQCNVLEIINNGWDFMIAHPPCTYLCNSGLRWLYIDGRKVNGWDYERCELMHQAAEFYNALAAAPIAYIAIENPRMHCYAITECGEPDQYVNLWQFGDAETKEHGFKLKGFPKLIPTDIVPVSQRAALVHREPPGVDRWKNRSRTQPGIAKAMSIQWGQWLLNQRGFCHV